MSVPSSNRFAYSKAILVLGPTAAPRVEDANADETGVSFNDPSLFGPVPRFGPTLMMMWKDVARVISGGDSYQQEIAGTQAFGSVASYSWSGGGSGSTKSYSYGTTGLKEITLTVTDDAGTSTTGRRWIQVVDPADIAATGGIRAFAHQPIVSDLGGGLGGSSVAVSVFDPAVFEDCVIGRLVAIYVEEYEGATSATMSLFAAGELFVGYITSVEHTILPDGDQLSFIAGTINSLITLENVVDGADHVFLDEVTAATDDAGDPIAGPVEDEVALLTIYPAHVMTDLTVGKALYHLLRYHLLLEIDGATRSLVEVCDFIRDWWNDGAAADYRSIGFNLPRGNLARAIAGMLPQGAWIVYGTRTGGLVVTKIHAAKTVPDAVVGTISEDDCYAGVRPTKGLEDVVRQVVLVQAAETHETTTDDILIGRYPDPAAASGSLYQPALGFWTTSADGLDALAEAFYNELNCTDRVEIALRGATFDLHNIAQVTITGRAAFPWSNKQFQVERSELARDHEWLGPVNQTLQLREILMTQEYLRAIAGSGLGDGVTTFGRIGLLGNLLLVRLHGVDGPIQIAHDHRAVTRTEGDVLLVAPTQEGPGLTGYRVVDHAAPLIGLIAGYAKRTTTGAVMAQGFMRWTGTAWVALTGPNGYVSDQSFAAMAAHVVGTRVFQVYDEALSDFARTHLLVNDLPVGSALATAVLFPSETDVLAPDYNAGRCRIYGFFEIDGTIYAHGHRTVGSGPNYLTHAQVWRLDDPTGIPSLVEQSFTAGTGTFRGEFQDAAVVGSGAAFALDEITTSGFNEDHRWYTFTPGGGVVFGSSDSRAGSFYANHYRIAAVGSDLFSPHRNDNSGGASPTLDLWRSTDGGTNWNLYVNVSVLSADLSWVNDVCAHDGALYYTVHEYTAGALGGAFRSHLRRLSGTSEVTIATVTSECLDRLFSTGGLLYIGTGTQGFVPTGGVTIAPRVYVYDGASLGQLGDLNGALDATVLAPYTAASPAAGRVSAFAYLSGTA